MIITCFLLLLAFTCFHKNMKAVLKLAWGRVVQVSLTFYFLLYFTFTFYFTLLFTFQAVYLEDQNTVT